MSIQQNEADNKADKVIKLMIKGMLGAAIIPAQVNWVFIATAMGTGVVSIGLCYGVELTKDEAWKLIKQFISAAGLTFIGLNVGSKILSMILATTGFGYFAAVALDAAISVALGYAVGESAKAYFKGERNNKELGKIFRERFSAAKKDSKVANI